jgi:hypothetical protein
MTSIKREFIRFEDRLVEVKKVLPGVRIKDVNGIKELYHCDTVLKKGDFMYFCISVEEAIIIED